MEAKSFEGVGAGDVGGAERTGAGGGAEVDAITGAGAGSEGLEQM